MEEKEEKKRKRGRPRKERRGGARPGAGRKKGVHIKENPLNAHISFRASEDTLRRVKALREQTKEDDIPFNRLFELWVEELAKDYGIE